MKEVYLGDGLYASCDGYQIKLRAPQPEGDHVVYLEVEALTAFLKFIKDLENE